MRKEGKQKNSLLTDWQHFFFFSSATTHFTLKSSASVDVFVSSCFFRDTDEMKSDRKRYKGDMKMFAGERQKACQPDLRFSLPSGGHGSFTSYWIWNGLFCLSSQTQDSRDSHPKVQAQPHESNSDLSKSAFWWTIVCEWCKCAQRCSTRKLSICSNLLPLSLKTEKTRLREGCKNLQSYLMGLFICILSQGDVFACWAACRNVCCAEIWGISKHLPLHYMPGWGVSSFFFFITK